MKVMVTGASGMLGHALVPRLEAAGHDVVAVRHPQDAQAPPPGDPAHHRETRPIDVTDYPALLAAALETRPDWVVHLAAWTDVDGCEADPDRAFLVNGLGARNASLAAAEAGAAVLAMSTDYVFEGSVPAPRREQDPVSPLGAYGRSKAAGEQGVREVNTRHAIVRTSWLYGAGGKNFVDTILSRARAGGPLRVVDDQRGSPTWTADLAEGVLALLDARQFGTYHVTGSGDCTWHEFAVAICETAGVKAEVAAISSAELVRAAKRPAYSVLHNGNYEHVTGRRMPHWRDALARYLQG
jgi:dTDP-4-dehydrorhamnose reductase